jgi:hypothetical protein
MKEAYRLPHGGEEEAFELGGGAAGDSVAAADEGEGSGELAVSAGEALIVGEGEAADKADADALADHGLDALDGAEFHDDVEGDAGGAGGGVDQVADGGARFEGNEGNADEIIPAEGGSAQMCGSGDVGGGGPSLTVRARWRRAPCVENGCVPGCLWRRRDELEFVFDEGDGEQVADAGDFAGEGDDAEVEFPGEDGGGHGAAAGFTDVEADAGMGLSNGGDDGRQEVSGGGGAAADADGAGLEADELANGFDAGVGGTEGFFGVAEEGAAGIGEFDAAAGAVEEFRADLGFEFAEHGGESRLGYAKFFRRAGDVASGGDGFEVAESGEFHGGG